MSGSYPTIKSHHGMATYVAPWKFVTYAMKAFQFTDSPPFLDLEKLPSYHYTMSIPYLGLSDFEDYNYSKIQIRKANIALIFFYNINLVSNFPKTGDLGPNKNWNSWPHGKDKYVGWEIKDLNSLLSLLCCTHTPSDSKDEWTNSLNRIQTQWWNFFYSPPVIPAFKVKWTIKNNGDDYSVVDFKWDLSNPSKSPPAGCTLCPSPSDLIKISKIYTGVNQIEFSIPMWKIPTVPSPIWPIPDEDIPLIPDWWSKPTDQDFVLKNLSFGQQQNNIAILLQKTVQKKCMVRLTAGKGSQCFTKIYGNCQGNHFDASYSSSPMERCICDCTRVGNSIGNCSGFCEQSWGYIYDPKNTEIKGFSPNTWCWASQGSSTCQNLEKEPFDKNGKSVVGNLNAGASDQAKNNIDQAYYYSKVLSDNAHVLQSSSEKQSFNCDLGKCVADNIGQYYNHDDCCSSTPWESESKSCGDAWKEDCFGTSENLINLIPILFGLFIIIAGIIITAGGIFYYYRRIKSKNIVLSSNK